MKTFEIYKHPALGIQAVKIGFTWPGFFFGVIWTLICRLWLHSAVIFGAIILLSTLIPDVKLATNTFLNAAISLGLSIIIGMNGNQWRRDNLTKRGFEKVTTIEADNKDAALGVFCGGQQKV